MSEPNAKYGIWGGRFQIIHKGHEYVLHYVDKNYSHVCVGIVNPNPRIPPCSILEHEKFKPEKNPLTYFQRVYLWNRLLRHHNIEAVIVPHWHPRRSLKLESTFLPQPKESRNWVIPFLPDEEYKIEDFKKAGENVSVLHDIPSDIKLVHSSDIKRLFDEKNKNFKLDIPERIQLETERFLQGESSNERYIIIPILEDNIHPLLICGGIQLSCDTGYKLIFAPTVNVADKKDWWKFEPIDDKSYFTFYEKHEIINSIMKAIKFYDYMVIPIIVKKKSCEIESFFPASNCRSWLFVSGINSNVIFKPFRYENILKIDEKKISNDVFDDMFIDVYNLKQELFNQRHYFEDLFDENESEENKKMKDFNFGDNMQVEHMNIIKGNVEGDINQIVIGTSKNSLEKIVSQILKNKDDNVESLIKQADVLYKSGSEDDGKRIIEKTVKNNIDSSEKRREVINKLKKFAIKAGDSIVIGLLLQAAKTLVFGA